jgi:hypothetical protein
VRFLSIVLRVFRLEVLLYHVYITNPLQTTFAQGRGGVKYISKVTVNSKEENSEDFCPNHVQEFGLRRKVAKLENSLNNSELLNQFSALHHREIFVPSKM